MNANSAKVTNIHGTDLEDLVSVDPQEFAQFAFHARHGVPQRNHALELRAFLESRKVAPLDTKREELDPSEFELVTGVDGKFCERWEAREGR